jgi:hypothetical protein
MFIPANAQQLARSLFFEVPTEDYLASLVELLAAKFSLVRDSQVEKGSRVVALRNKGAARRACAIDVDIYFGRKNGWSLVYKGLDADEVEQAVLRQS